MYCVFTKASILQISKQLIKMDIQECLNIFDFPYYCNINKLIIHIHNQETSLWHAAAASLAALAR